MAEFPYRRMVVIGTTSSGKSTLAKRLATRFDLDFIELDALHWEPNWTPAKPEVLRARVEAATGSRSWIVAGNYRAVRDLVWPKAEAVIWLDYSFLFIFRRLFVRTIQRSLSREELWNGNREKFWWHLKLWSDESLFRWLVKTYWRRKREYAMLFTLPEYQHLKIFHFKTEQQTEIWLASL